jgi:hypothetical protein
MPLNTFSVQSTQRRFRRVSGNSAQERRATWNRRRSEQDVPHTPGACAPERRQHDAHCGSCAFDSRSRLTRCAKPRTPGGAALPDGEFEILTYYYDVPIQDSPTGNGVMRLRTIMQ